MATDKYDLHTIDYSVQGWDSILTTDMEKLDDVVESRSLVTLGEVAVAYQALYLKSDGKYWKAKADSTTTMPCLGLAIEGGGADDSIRLLKFGEITNVGWAWATIGGKIYLSDATAGTLTQTPPSININIQVVGYALTATKMLVTLVNSMSVSALPLFADETELTLDISGGITITQVRHTIDTFGDAASDDLVTINGGATVNLIVLRAEADARTVVVKHGTGNIWLQGKADISLDDLEDGVLLFWDATNSKWFDIGGGGGGGGLANIVEDVTPQLGGDLEYNNQNQVFNTTLTSDETASGDIITVTFGEAVVFGKLCYPDSADNEWKLALGTNAAVKHPALGVALETKGNGETGKLLLRGLIRSSTYFSVFALGDLLWLSDGTAGLWVNAGPSDSGDIVQHVGWVLAANYAFFNPDYTYIEIT